MKKIILLALTVLMMVGCGNNDSINKLPSQSGNILTIDSCQYIICWYGGYKGFIHHNNCRFCKERRKKELEELVTKLKINNYENIFNNYFIVYYYYANIPWNTYK